MTDSGRTSMLVSHGVTPALGDDPDAVLSVLWTLNSDLATAEYRRIPANALLPSIGLLADVVVYRRSDGRLGVVSDQEFTATAPQGPKGEE